MLIKAIDSYGEEFTPRHIYPDDVYDEDMIKQAESKAFEIIKEKISGGDIFEIKEYPHGGFFLVKKGFDHLSSSPR